MLKSHVLIHASKVFNVANALRYLRNTTRRGPLILSRQAVLLCVLPVAHFAAEIWWLGKTRSKQIKSISNRFGNHIYALNKVYILAARPILPVYRTTPNQALLREAWVNLAEIFLDNIVRRAAVWTRRLDDHHPLYCRALKVPFSQILSRFARSLDSLPMSEQMNPLTYPPLEKDDPQNSPIFPSTTEISSPESGCRVFQEFLKKLSKNDIMIYNNGSKLPNGIAGAGFVIFQLGHQIFSGTPPQGMVCEAEDGEVHAALQEIKYAISLTSCWTDCIGWSEFILIIYVLKKRNLTSTER